MQVIQRKIIKYICFVVVLIFLVLAIPSRASALTVGSLYSDLNGTNSNVNNMVLWADRYESFNNSKYIAFRDSVNSYYLVWGDSDVFDVSFDNVTCSDCSYLRYYRESNSTDWNYLFVEGDTLSLATDKLVVTNLEGVRGFSNSLIDELEFRRNSRVIFIFYGVMIVFLGLLVSLRRG